MNEEITIQEHIAVCEKLNDLYQDKYLTPEEWQQAYAEQLDKIYEIK